MLVKPLFSNVMIDFPYNLNKNMQYKHLWKFFEVDCLHQHTVIPLYRLDWDEKLLEIFTYPSNNLAIHGPELNL